MDTSKNDTIRFAGLFPQYSNFLRIHQTLIDRVNHKKI